MLFALRPYHRGDRADVDALLDDDSDPLLVAQLHPLHGPDRDGDRWRRTVLAVTEQGEVVGAGTAARNRVHPDTLSTIIEVSAGHRRRGVGSRLLAGLRSVAPDGATFRGKVHESDRPGYGFAMAVGAQVVVRSPGLIFSPPYHKLRAWIARQPTPDGARVDSLARCSDEELLENWLTLYVRVHEDWSPAAARPTLRGVFTELVGNIRADSSAGSWSRRDGQLLAVAFAQAESPSTVTVVAETLRAGQPGGLVQLAAVLARCFEQLIAVGVSEITLDGHNVDEHLAPLTATMPATHRNPLLLVALT